MLKMVLIIFVVTIVVVGVASLIIAKHQKNKRNPKYKPVLSKGQNMLAVFCLALGVLLIAGGVVLAMVTQKMGVADGAAALYEANGQSDVEAEQNMVVEVYG